MKKFWMFVACLAIAGSAFALGNRETMTEEEALAFINQKVTDLGLTLEDAEAASQAFLAMHQAGLRVSDALTLIGQALDEGVVAENFKGIAVQARTMAAEGKTARELQSGMKAMVQEQLKTASNRSGSATGSADGSGAGQQAGQPAAPAPAPAPAPTGGSTGASAGGSAGTPVPAPAPAPAPAGGSTGTSAGSPAETPAPGGASAPAPGSGAGPGK